MKITRLETIHIRPRWLVLKVHTDVGLVGIGEPTLEGRSQTVATAIAELGRWLIGQDPRRIEHIWQHLHRGGFYRGGPVLCSAISGIDMALWDILGKHLNVPVYQLLGGAVRDRVRLYGRVAEDQTEYIEPSSRKFTAYKMAPMEAMHWLERPAVRRAAVEKVARARKAYGWEIDIALDFHGRTTMQVARELARAMEPYEPLFIEEPVLPGDTAMMAELARSTTIPIATGERLFTRWQFQDLIAERAVSVVQPDLAHAGGISEGRKIAAMAEPRDIAMAPHCPLGPVALAACLQLDATIPNFLCQEQASLGEDYLVSPIEVEGGYAKLPDGPGLGIELDEQKIEAGRFDGAWDNPKLKLEDGAFAEW